MVEKLSSGDPIYRIVNNNRILFVFILDNSVANNYNIGEEVFLNESNPKEI